MKAIILAAGRGSRMGNLTDVRPKCMVEFEGKPLLTWQLEACHAAGVDEIGVVTGYRKEAFNGLGLTLFENAEWEITNMVRSLQCANAWLNASPCIVSYSDIFYEPSAIRALMQQPSPLAILYDRNWLALWQARFADVLTDAETFRINDVNMVTEIGHRARHVEEIQGQYMGLLAFTPQSWEEISRVLAAMPAHEVDALSMTSLLSQVIGAGQALRGVPYEGRWGEVDSETDLEVYRRMS
jgi:choline kinase